MTNERTTFPLHYPFKAKLNSSACEHIVCAIAISRRLYNVNYIPNIHCLYSFSTGPLLKRSSNFLVVEYLLSVFKSFWTPCREKKNLHINIDICLVLCTVKTYSYKYARFMIAKSSYKKDYWEFLSRSSLKLKEEEEEKKIGWRYSVMYARRLRQRCYVVQMKRCYVLNVMRRSMELICYPRNMNAFVSSNVHYHLPPPLLFLPLLHSLSVINARYISSLSISTNAFGHKD